MRARAKSSKKSALFFAVFSFSSFFSFFVLFQLFLASKHTFKTPKLLTDLQAEKTEKADREIRSPEPKRGSQRGKTHWVSYVFRWKMLWNFVQFLTIRSSRAPAVPDLVHVFLLVNLMFVFVHDSGTSAHGEKE